MKFTITLVVDGCEYKNTLESFFDTVVEALDEAEAEAEAEEGIEYDEDGVAWWLDEDANVWYFFDEEADDWFEAEVEEDE